MVLSPRATPNLTTQFPRTANPIEYGEIALLEFGTHYAQSKTGNIPHQQFPEPLQSVSIAKIPTVSG
jgi:predicted metal-binding protein